MTAATLTRRLALATVLAASGLLTLGWLTTSFRAGMADPVWPTEPWFLAVNGPVWREPDRAFLLEHTHRAAGYLAGGLATLLAVAAWCTDRRPATRWFGLLAVGVLVGVYGGFHRDMSAASAARLAGRSGAVWPASSGLLSLLAAGAVGLAAATTAGPGVWLRRLASASLVAVMVQGLLGGYRVYLDQLAGVELAAVHGTFGQVVFCLLLATWTVARPVRELPADERDRVGTLSLVLPGLVFGQLVWGVLVRHTGGGLVQRFHLLTAFLVVGLGVWLAVRVRATSAGRRHLGGAAVHLLGLLAVQVTLGVDAWMGKFAAVGADAGVPPMLRPVTVGAASVRTLHALVGAALLASAVVLALRVWRRAGPVEPAPAVEESAVAAVAAYH